MPALVRIGDVYAFNLPNGRIGHAQLIHIHPMFGHLVEVKSLISDHDANVVDVLSSPPLFRPVFVGLPYSVRVKAWRKIGNSPVLNFEFPLFRKSTGVNWTIAPGTYDNWELWDGEKYKFIGKLPVELRCLEGLTVWSALALEERIVTGARLPYGEMF